MYIFKRGNYYHLHYLDTESGKAKRISTGERTKAGAVKFVSRFEKQLNSIVDKNIITLNDFVIEYLEYAEQTFTSSYQTSIKLSFRKLEDYIYDRKLNEITSRDAEHFILFIYKNAKYAANLYHRTLKASFNKAIKWGYLNENPFNKFTPPKVIKKLPEFIEEEQLDQILLETRNPIMKKIIFTAFHTGLRQSELINLKWSEVDFDKNIIAVKNNSGFTTKSKKDRFIPMNQKLKEQLSSMCNKSKLQYVFPNNNQYKFHPDTVSHKFKEAVRKAKLSEGIHFHSLRHSFASNLVQKGVSLYVVKELLGHESISTTQIYAHLDNSALVRAVNLLS